MPAPVHAPWPGIHKLYSCRSQSGKHHCGIAMVQGGRPDHSVLHGLPDLSVNQSSSSRDKREREREGLSHVLPSSHCTPFSFFSPPFLSLASPMRGGQVNRGRRRPGRHSVCFSIFLPRHPAFLVHRRLAKKEKSQQRIQWFLVLIPNYFFHHHHHLLPQRAGPGHGARPHQGSCPQVVRCRLAKRTGGTATATTHASPPRVGPISAVCWTTFTLRAARMCARRRRA